jgi:hypothetical protein
VKVVSRGLFYATIPAFARRNQVHYENPEYAESSSAPRSEPETSRMGNRILIKQPQYSVPWCSSVTQPAIRLRYEPSTFWMQVRCATHHCLSFTLWTWTWPAFSSDLHTRANHCTNSTSLDYETQRYFTLLCNNTEENRVLLRNRPVMLRWHFWASWILIKFF